MKLLIVCNWGKNRSQYLADYLQQKGYEAKAGGILSGNDNMITQEMVDAAETIIFVQPKIKADFLKLFQTDSQQLLALDVEDRLDIIAPDKKEITDAQWLQLQQQLVYPELEKQMQKYLPL